MLRNFHKRIKNIPAKHLSAPHLNLLLVRNAGHMQLPRRIFAMRSSPRLALASLAAVSALLVGVVSLPEGPKPAAAQAQENAVTFPPLDQFVQYTTVQRGNVLELMMTSRETIAAIQAGQDLPVGTQLVLVDHRDGELLRYLVSQRVGAGRDDWQFQSFLPDRQTIQPDENPARCFSCHQSRQDRSYIFTYTDAMRFE
ncbi:UNVERIFIED_ORG: hypothetical protein GGD48_005552 [Rhizobium etli]|nr:cytochrome P460 family protein [Rhizobium sp. IE4771]